ncbi:HET-domain-containing protein [Massarina eburnea CBS 473.64]|uniref:HET-domain-containing protein n=1 Tax=Massarina eburnea CBS 473.64 TaxID=1395130 RepID=A0A6A6RJU9_9PLEO|nr:HET-domain-containing protein [Massarina eburnea CBS 473.64]
MNTPQISTIPAIFSHLLKVQHHEDSIRILVLYPSLNESDTILCTLQNGRLSDESLEYTALSYTWGDPAQQQAIFFRRGTRELLVRRNCHDALRHLRHGYRNRLLWIDAICINQTDLAERARQVRMMDDIYEYACNVTVSLGEETEGTRILFEELVVANDRGASIRRSPSDIVVRELDFLFERPWFKRVCVLQEVCAKVTLTTMCGPVRASSFTLDHVMFSYNRNTLNRRPPEELFESREFLATDPRDKVFALRSFIGSKRSEIDPLINYAQTLEQCFTRGALFLLPVIGPRILTAVRHPHRMDMPLWIPDWSQDLPLSVYYFVNECHDEATDERISPTFSFNNADETEMQMERLYCSLNEVKKCSILENMQKDHNISDYIGPKILHAMSLLDGDDLHEHLARGRFSGRGDNNPIHEENVNSLLDNGELATVPSSARHGDLVCIISGSDSTCVLRPDTHGNCTLISGDCYIFITSFLSRNFPRWDFFGEYIECNQDRFEGFKIR